MRVARWLSGARDRKAGGQPCRKKRKTKEDAGTGAAGGAGRRETPPGEADEGEAGRRQSPPREADAGEAEMRELPFNDY